jgi:hypothetical protein
MKKRNCVACKNLLSGLVRIAPAGCQPAKQQVANLRYDTSRLVERIK